MAEATPKMIRAVEPGARWLRCDLHVHTPFDGEKKFGEDIKTALESLRSEKTTRLAEIAERFVNACRAAANGEGIDLVALTDHNSIEGYRVLKVYFDGIGREARDKGQPMPVILPGVELTVGGERPIHFLVIFAASTAVEQIEGVIQHVFGVKERFDPKTGTPRSTGESIETFLDRLYKYCHPPTGERHLSFVLLPAHADSHRGVGRETGAADIQVATSLWDEMKGHLRQWAVSRTDWNGFETAKPFDQLPQAFKELLLRWSAARRDEDWDSLSEERKARHRSQRHWPLVECSDPHKYEAIGTRFSWLKMEVPDVEGIRLALLDPESRLRRMSAGPPARPYPHLMRVHVRGTDFFEEATVPLNPSLTTLIGGRGSGKSTLVEYVRYALDRARPDDFDGENESDIYDSVKKLLDPKQQRDYGETSGTLLPDHAVELDVWVAGRLYRIRRTATGTQVVPDPGSPEATPAALDVRALISPRVLSQRQIARIAKDPVAQRRELDELLGPERLRDFETRHRALTDQITQLQGRRAQLADQAKTLPARQTELRTVTDQITFIEGGGRREVFQRFVSYQAEQRWIDNVRRELEKTAQAIEQQAGSTEGLTEHVAQPAAGPTGAWVAEVASRVGAAVESAATALREKARSLRELAAAIATEQTTKWTPGFEAARQEYQTLSEELRAKGVDMAQHEKLLQKRAQLEQEIGQLAGVAKDQERTETEARTTREQLVQLHEERLAWRREQAGTLEAADADVRLELAAFRDRTDLATRREQWSGGTGLQARDWDILVDFVFGAGGSVSDRWGQLLGALRADVERTRTQGRAIDSAKSALASVLGTVPAGQLTRNFWNALQKGDRLRLDEMERFLPEDEVLAKVRGADGIFKPIAQGSVGQRSTAVLSLLLSAGDQPLIIDQPEDDLDNQYIYDVVVGLLRKRKFSRQIVIATHNANIPVNGDAELITAFGVENRLGTIKVQGSIDRPEVKEQVSVIMEGSAEAFRLRRDRYGY
jgi:ABC-type lipoprotein export system ATPase subunit